MTNSPTRARDWLRQLDAQLQYCNYTGPDPYDALASPGLRRLPTPFLRRAAVQGIKRSAIDLRRVAAVPGLRMAKTLGVVLGSLGVDEDLPSASARRRTLADQLAHLQRADGGWGYEFDVQMRWGGYPKEESNVVVTAFVIDGFLHAGLPVPTASRVIGFLSETLDRGDFVAYAPASRALIHNANILGAATLELLSPGHPLVARALQTCLGGQKSNGTWPYGRGSSTSWVDSFHTAYVLYCLRFLRHRYPEAAPAYDRGLRAWLDLGFDQHGTPRYYLSGGRDRPDVHNIANALTLLATLAPSSADARQRIDGGLSALGRLRRRDGTFSTRRSGAAYVRWESAHAHRALALISRLKD